MHRPTLSRKQTQLRRQLAQARRDAKLTQTALAKKLGRPQSYVSKFESGERRIDVIEFLEIARALNVDPNRIIADLERR